MPPPEPRAEPQRGHGLPTGRQERWWCSACRGWSPRRRVPTVMRTTMVHGSALMERLAEWTARARGRPAPVPVTTRCRRRGPNPETLRRSATPCPGCPQRRSPRRMAPPGTSPSRRPRHRCGEPSSTIPSRTSSDSGSMLNRQTQSNFVYHTTTGLPYAASESVAAIEQPVRRIPRPDPGEPTRTGDEGPLERLSRVLCCLRDVLLFTML